MATEIRYARRWHEWQIGDKRIMATLDCYGVQKQVGKFRERHPDCSDWRWTTRSIGGGKIVVERVK